MRCEPGYERGRGLPLPRKACHDVAQRVAVVRHQLAGKEGHRRLGAFGPASVQQHEQLGGETARHVVGLRE
jgi:hypothetical protein